jgi:hypothetical protein
MARRSPASRPIVWHVVSVFRRSRDGPERLAEVYRILVGQRRRLPRCDVGRRETSLPEEYHDGDSLVRSGVDRASGTRTDY